MLVTIYFRVKAVFHNALHCFCFIIIIPDYMSVTYKTRCESIMFNSAYRNVLLCHMAGLVISSMLLFAFGVVPFAHSVTKMSLALRLMQSCRRPRMINSVRDFDEHCSAISPV